MQTSSLTVSMMDFFMTSQLRFTFVDLNHKELHLTLHIKKNLFPKTKRYFCSAIDVSQVLEFPSAKFYLLKQSSINIITHMSTLKVTLNRSRLFGGGYLMEEALILPPMNFEKRAS